MASQRAPARWARAGTLRCTIRRPTASQPLANEDRIGWNSSSGFGGPAVVGPEQDWVEPALRLRRRGRELGAGAVVVPVVVLAGVAEALHALDRGERPGERRHELALSDEAEPARGDRAPHVGADVRR